MIKYGEVTLNNAKKEQKHLHDNPNIVKMFRNTLNNIYLKATTYIGETCKIVDKDSKI